MKPKLAVNIVLVAFLAASVVYLVSKETRRGKEISAPARESAETAAPNDAARGGAAVAAGTETAAAEPRSRAGENAVIIYYFHGTRRCATCRTIEQYTNEAILGGFAAELRDETILWRVVNVEDPGNGHFIEDYELSTKSVVLVRLIDGKRADWKSLPRIWDLTGDRAAFIVYIQDEVKRFVEGNS